MLNERGGRVPIWMTDSGDWWCWLSSRTLQDMVTRMVTGSTIDEREKAEGASRSEQGPEFLSHSRAMALQLGMIKARLLEFVNQSRQATISHW